MKTIKFFAAAAMLIATVACNNSNKLAKIDGVELPTSAEIDSVSYLLGVNFGAMIKNYHMDGLNYSQMMKGINDMVNSKGNQNNPDFTNQFKINPEDMNRIIPAYIQKMEAYTAAANLAEQAKFLDQIKKQAGVQTSESGLSYIIQEAGSYNKPVEKDSVYVHYKLSLKDGSVIEEVTEDNPSVMLSLVPGRLIQGWIEGLQYIGEGGKITLYVPAELGYGERGSNGIEPNTPLVFDIQVDSIRHYVEPEN